MFENKKFSTMSISDIIFEITGKNTEIDEEVNENDCKRKLMIVQNKIDNIKNGKNVSRFEKMNISEIISEAKSYDSPDFCQRELERLKRELERLNSESVPTEPEIPEPDPEPVPTPDPEPVPTPDPEPVPTSDPEPVPTPDPEPVPRSFSTSSAPEPVPLNKYFECTRPVSKRMDQEQVNRRFSCDPVFRSGKPDNKLIIENDKTIGGTFLNLQDCASQCFFTDKQEENDPVIRRQIEAAENEENSKIIIDLNEQREKAWKDAKRIPPPIPEPARGFDPSRDHRGGRFGRFHRG